MRARCGQEGQASACILQCLATDRQLSSAAELEVDVGTHTLKLAAEGVYRLDLPLPQAVDADRARCRFDKKRRTLTITMPLAKGQGG